MKIEVNMAVLVKGPTAVEQCLGKISARIPPTVEGKAR